VTPLYCRNADLANMLALKIGIVLLFVVSGGAVALPGVQTYLDRHKWLQYAAWGIAGLAGIYFVAGLFGDVDGTLISAYQRTTIGP